MEHEAYFATVGQVLPTLMIALAVEYFAYQSQELRKIAKIIALNNIDDDALVKVLDSHSIIGLGVTLGVTFIASEMIVLAALVFEPKGLINELMIATTAICVFFMTYYVVVFPLSRMNLGKREMQIEALREARRTRDAETMSKAVAPEAG